MRIGKDFESGGITGCQSPFTFSEWINTVISLNAVNSSPTSEPQRTTSFCAFKKLNYIHMCFFNHAEAGRLSAILPANMPNNRKSFVRKRKACVSRMPFFRGPLSQKAQINHKKQQEKITSVNHIALSIYGQKCIQDTVHFMKSF